ncbi:hypothetical protein FQN57_002569 [Myotisia sp. PD_48]|nr:hypothetical protein FQN57_002569 [Myotisia sp. PD_48]
MDQQAGFPVDDYPGEVPMASPNTFNNMAILYHHTHGEEASFASPTQGTPVYSDCIDPSVIQVNRQGNFESQQDKTTELDAGDIELANLLTNFEDSGVPSGDCGSIFQPGFHSPHENSHLPQANNFHSGQQSPAVASTPSTFANGSGAMAMKQSPGTSNMSTPVGYQSDMNIANQTYQDSWPNANDTMMPSEMHLDPSQYQGNMMSSHESVEFVAAHLPNDTAAAAPNSPAPSVETSTSMEDTDEPAAEETAAEASSSTKKKIKDDELPPPGYRDPWEDIVLQFNSAQEANDHRPDKADYVPKLENIPRTLEEKKVKVLQLIRAMRSLEDATDNPGMIKPFYLKKFSLDKMEVCAWNLLDAAIRRQQFGPFLTPEEESMKNRSKKNNQDFNARFRDMIRILRVRKTVCRHLLDPYYLLQYIDDPNSCLSRVDANKSLNAKKKAAIEAGKKVLSKQKVQAAKANAAAGAGDESAAHTEQVDETPETVQPGEASLASPFTTPKGKKRNTKKASRKISTASPKRTPKKKPAPTPTPTQTPSTPSTQTPQAPQVPNVQLNPHNSIPMAAQRNSMMNVQTPQMGQTQPGHYSFPMATQPNFMVNAQMPTPPMTDSTHLTGQFDASFTDPLRSGAYYPSAPWDNVTNNHAMHMGMIGNNQPSYTMSPKRTPYGTMYASAPQPTQYLFQRPQAPTGFQMPTFNPTPQMPGPPAFMTNQAAGPSGKRTSPSSEASGSPKKRTRR